MTTSTRTITNYEVRSRSYERERVNHQRGKLAKRNERLKQRYSLPITLRPKTTLIYKPRMLSPLSSTR